MYSRMAHRYYSHTRVSRSTWHQPVFFPKLSFAIDRVLSFLCCLISMVAHIVTRAGCWPWERMAPRALCRRCRHHVLTSHVTLLSLLISCVLFLLKERTWAPSRCALAVATTGSWRHGYWCMRCFAGSAVQWHQGRVNWKFPQCSFRLGSMFSTVLARRSPTVYLKRELKAFHA